MTFLPKPHLTSPSGSDLSYFRYYLKNVWLWFLVYIQFFFYIQTLCPLCVHFALANSATFSEHSSTCGRTQQTPLTLVYIDCYVESYGKTQLLVMLHGAVFFYYLSQWNQCDFLTFRAFWHIGNITVKCTSWCQYKNSLYWFPNGMVGDKSSLRKLPTFCTAPPSDIWKAHAQTKWKSFIIRILCIYCIPTSLIITK